MGTAVFGAPEFKASNGLVVKPAANGGVEVGQPGYRDYTPPAASFALEEFFQAKRDEELGRWRWPENPAWVVYPDEDGVVALNETDPSAGIGQTRSTVESYPTSYGADAARAYFKAHTERKPWHDAESGEVWIINIGDELEGDRANLQAVVVSNEGKFLYRDGGSVRVDQDFIIDGRRIWPVDEMAPAELHESSSQAGLASIRGGL